MENVTPIKELELYIIRHGQSMGNAGYGSRTDLTEKEMHDPVLTEKGILQAENAGRYLRGIEFDAVISSAMLRAVQTATGIIKHQNRTKTLNVLPLACEMMFAPEYKGITMEEIKSVNPNAVLAPDVEPGSPMIYSNLKDNDEAATYERAGKVIEYLRAHFKNGEKVALVSHAAFITYIVFTLMGYTQKSPCFDIDFDNTGITKVTFYKQGTNKYGDTVFSFINDTSHLKENGMI